MAVLVPAAPATLLHPGPVRSSISSEPGCTSRTDAVCGAWTDAPEEQRATRVQQTTPAHAGPVCPPGACRGGRPGRPGCTATTSATVLRCAGRSACRTVGSGCRVCRSRPDAETLGRDPAKPGRAEGIGWGDVPGGGAAPRDQRRASSRVLVSGAVWATVAEDWAGAGASVAAQVAVTVALIVVL